ncbi:unnamed protein product [Rotaria socialis]|uniref:Uncharacterized protein n=1 Tax=Rotaria socialis TaxID=392032 RepID=A0A818CLV7_9BILA|nr:unnamed protein product [Rotaria socialis]CAF3330601.1 unnamed protein product [Rotaria socialis]CAF3373204.1 unnamed protein product [Rotaria socialis]CAF3430590.1 unnamed protein product [Rotaria socialis]CAF3747489.1 unnamed protein product [Rotaria socialis]
MEKEQKEQEGELSKRAIIIGTPQTSFLTMPRVKRTQASFLRTVTGTERRLCISNIFTKSTALVTTIRPILVTNPENETQQGTTPLFFFIVTSHPLTLE